LASRKFNAFIDLFVGEVDFRALGNDKWEAHSFRAWTAALEQNAPQSSENQPADGIALRGRLFLELAVKRLRDINRRADGCPFHPSSIARVP